jgi:predicted permease
MKRRFRLSVGKAGRAREVDRELRFHLEMRTQEFIDAGMSPERARAAALAAFGDVAAIGAECREVRTRRARERRVRDFLQGLAQDAGFAVRTLRKSPGFALVVVATLALGIGANTAIFSVINGVLLRRLPYGGGERLVLVRQPAVLAGSEDARFSVPDVADYRAQATTLDGLVEYHSMTFTLLGRQEPLRVRTGVVSAEFFDVMGVSALHGRTFLRGEDAPGAPPVLVLSHRFWQEKLGGDPSVVGKTFEMNDRVHTVVGVLPPLPPYPDDNDVYMPTSSCPFRSAEHIVNGRGMRMVALFGRLKPGETVGRAQADLAMIGARLRAQYPVGHPASMCLNVTATPLQEELIRRARPTFFILLGTAGLVLLIACANVANLTLARVVRRERELAVRVALGAGRARLLRLLLTESTLLALAGGALGLLLAAGGLGVLTRFAARFTARAGEIGIDGTVLLFTLGVSVLSGMAFGAMPALASRSDLVSALKDGGAAATSGRRRQRVRGALVASQVALAFVLLIAAGLMVRSLIKLQGVDPGFDPENVVSMRVDLNWTKYDTRGKTDAFYRRLLERVRGQAGVRSAAVANTFPLNGQPS